jgi:predicted Zn-dependent protease
MSEGLRQARHQMQNNEWLEAERLLTQLLADSKAGDVQSASLYRDLAVVSDAKGEFQMAVRHIEHALALDPLSPEVIRSFEIISTRIRAALAEAEAASPEVPKLYQLLLGSDTADSESHLMMARHLEQTGQFDASLRLLQALTLLSPSFRTGWTLLAQVARKLGQEDLARSAELDAKLSPTQASQVFPVPGSTSN